MPQHDANTRPADSATVPLRRLWALLLAAGTATMTFGLGNICAPRIGSTLDIPVSAVALVLGVFGAAFAAGMIVAARLGDWVGRARVATVGLVGLVVTSAAVALAPGFVVLLATRFAQGAAFALVMPQILATIQVVVAQGERAKALAGFAASGGAGTAAGQFLGGVALAAFPGALGWRAAFALTGVVAGICLIGMRWVPDTRSTHHEGLDVGASVLIAVALMALLTGISLGGTLRWPWWSLALIGAAFAGFLLLARNQARRERSGRPTLTPPSVLTLRPVALGLVMAGLFFTGFGGFMYAFAVMSQRGEGLSALWSGALMLPFVASFIAGSLAVPGLLRRFGDRLMPYAAVVQFAGLVTAAALANAIAESHGLRWALIMLVPFLFVGFAQAAQFGPLIGTIMGEVPTAVAGLSGGLVATVQQAALGLGAATLGGFFVAQAGPWGWPVSFAVTLLLQAATALGFGGCAVVLHRHRRAETDATSQAAPA